MLTWFCWAESNGARQKMYGCQLTFGNVFSQQFNPASIWKFANGNGLPYLNLSPVANTGQQPPNFQDPPTTWQMPGQQLNANAPVIQARRKPGVPLWDKYHAAFWWP